MIDPQLQPFLADWQAHWARLGSDATPKDRRAHMEAVGRAFRQPTPDDVDTDAEHWIDSPAGKVRLRVFRHRAGGVQPCLIYLHGGGWTQGSPETHWDITARIAADNRQTVFSVDYAKAPERPFPAAVQQSAAVVEWAFANAASLEIDPARIAIGGDSAGANIAAALTLKFRDSGCRLAAQLLIYPAVCFEMARPSFAENPDGPIISTATMPATFDMYLPNRADRTDPLAAPLHAASHAGLPPAYVAVAAHDPLRDDGLAYAEALDSAGVDVTLDRGPGLIHGYLRALAYCGASRASLASMCAWLRER
jgi:acetyl esterase/lipase